MSGELAYGIEPENIYATIVEGRPNGMPSFQGKIPDYQVWQLVAYVRSMSGQLSKDVAPSRSDHMSYKPAEQSSPKEHPPKEHPAQLKPEHSQ
jgi:cytochrome c oxidase cbb3-type subunit 3